MKPRSSAAKAPTQNWRLRGYKKFCASYQVLGFKIVNFETHKTLTAIFEMTLRSTNFTLGIIQIIICSLTIVPITIQIIVSQGGGFGFGLMFLPILIILCCSIPFGLIGLLNYFENYKWVRVLFIGTHILTSFASFGYYLTMPFLPFIVITIPLSIWFITSMTRENIGKQLLLTNGFFTACMIAYISFWANGSNKTLIEYLFNIWR